MASGSKDVKDEAPGEMAQRARPQSGLPHTTPESKHGSSTNGTQGPRVHLRSESETA